MSKILDVLLLRHGEGGDIGLIRVKSCLLTRAQSCQYKNCRLTELVGASEIFFVILHITEEEIRSREETRWVFCPITRSFVFLFLPRISAWQHGNKSMERQRPSLSRLEQENSQFLCWCPWFTFHGSGAFSLEFPYSLLRQSPGLFTFRTYYKAVFYEEHIYYGLVLFFPSSQLGWLKLTKC